MLWTTLWTLIVVLALAALLRWSQSYDPGTGAIAFTAAAFIWATFRAFGLQGVNWTFIRPLAAGWIVLFIILAVATVALIAFGWTPLATVVGWVALILAVLLPINDIFTKDFWVAWVNGPVEDKLIILGLLIVGIVFLWWFPNIIGMLAISLAVIMLVLWGGVSLVGAPPATVTPAPNASSPPAAPKPQEDSAKPDPQPEVDSDRVLKDSRGAIVGWDQLITSVEAQDATWFIDEVNAAEGTTGFDWSDIQKMAGVTMRDNGEDKLIDARRVLVFGASSSEISNAEARKLAKMPAKMPVIRLNRSCFTPVGGTEVCPTGDARVVVVLTPFKVKEGKFTSFTYGSGVAMLPQNDGMEHFSVVKYH